LTTSNIFTVTNINASNLITASNITTSNLTTSNIFTGSNINASGNISAGGNITATSNISAGGNIAATSNISAGGNIAATGDVTAASDIRIKTNIIEIDSPLEKISQLRGVYYTRLDDSNTSPSRHLGVIAQEVELVLPEVVSTDTSENKNKSVAYGNIVALLIEAIKAQQSTIEGIQAILSSRT